MAARCSAQCSISPLQRAFQPTDGCCENILTLDNIIYRAARLREFPLAMATIDVAKAFDSVSHESILRAAERLGVPDKLKELLASLYHGATTEIRRDTKIQLKQGVRQGDPWSPFLFNAVIDEAVEAVVKDGAGEEFPAVLAFADDLVLLARTPERLQKRLDETVSNLAKAGLRVNATKCASLTIRRDGKRKRVVVDQSQRLTVEGQAMEALGPTDKLKYLGVSIGFHGTHFEPEAPLKEGLMNIREVPMKPQQKMYLLTKHLIPAQYHKLVFGRVTAKELRKADLAIRSSVREILKLPKDTPLGFFHAKEKDGGLGVPELRATIPAMIKSRTDALKASNPPYSTRSLGSAQFKHFRERARILRHEGLSLDTKERVREAQKRKLYSSADGYGLKEAGNAPSSTLTWVTDGVMHQKGAAFIGAVKLRGGLIDTPARRSRGRDGSSTCDYGCGTRATLAHILQTCPRTWGPRIARHDSLVAYMTGRLIELNFSVEEEETVRTEEGVRKPDIVARKGARAIVIDAQVVSDGHPLDHANAEKVNYYNKEAVKSAVAQKEQRPVRQVEVKAATISWRGIWSKTSAKELLEIGLKTHDLDVMARRAVEKGFKITTFWRRSTARRGGARRGEYDGRPPQD